MLTTEFHFSYPEELVATEPQRQFRIAHFNQQKKMPQEISKLELFDLFSPGDVLAINNSLVLNRRVTTASGLEIFFLNEIEPNIWSVLFPARSVKDGESFMLPGQISAQLLERGLPQLLRVSKELAEDYFLNYGELALPPYIQKARNERHNRPQDKSWYQTAWAEVPGSFAAPTASLHFTSQDICDLKVRGVVIAPLTLHVGLGTFLPIKTKKIDEHKMHAEHIIIPEESVEILFHARKNKRKVWALGTTATRSLESWGQGRLEYHKQKKVYFGDSDLFIKPGYAFEVVNALLTNFHQPQTTLLALVSAFAQKENVLQTYRWAIDKKFRLFSYGDLSVWT